MAKGHRCMLCTLLWCCWVCVLSAILDDAGEFQKNLPAHVIWAVEGRDAELPCDVTPPIPSDSVNMVFWFKDSTGIPLYSLDSRGGPLMQASHLATTDDLGSRAFFLCDGDSSRARLRVQQVRRSDEGVFRCRVDFTNSPTRNFRVNLTLVVQPSYPRIFNAQGNEVLDSAGPFLENHELFLSCQVQGGRPAPSVTWWYNGTIIDSVVDTSEEASTTVNQLFISKVKRSFRDARFECRASSSDIAGFRQKEVPLIVYLMPQRVRISTPDELLSTRLPQLLRCETSGSHPPAKIVWMLGNRPVRNAVMVSDTENATTSILTLEAKPEDDGKELVCRADNPRFPGGSKEDRRTIRVAYPPEVSVYFDSDERSQLVEGGKVRLRCKTKSVPAVHKYTWYHNGHLIEYDEAAGTLPSDDTLDLQRISKSFEGEYSCSAANSEGETQGEPIRLKIQYAPRCRDGYEVVEVGAVALESVMVKCHVDASPPNVRFSWTYNNSRDVLPVLGGRMNNAGLTSQLQFTPSSPGSLGLGTLACWASNAVGQQMQPCLFHLVPAKIPEPPHDCSLRSTCPRCVEIICEAGSDGGLQQRFVLEVNEVEVPLDPILGGTTLSDQADKSTPLIRVQQDEPVFRLDELQPDRQYHLIVYSVNARGRSDPPVQLSHVRPPADTLHGDAGSIQSSSEETPDDLEPPLSAKHSLALILGALIAGAAIVVVGVATVSALVFCRRKPPPRRPPPKEETLELRDASEGFGEGFQRRSLEWRDRAVRASLYLHDTEGRSAQPISLGNNVWIIDRQ